MVEEIFKKAGKIFQDAIEIADTIERASYLDEACKESETLRAEVEKLLKAHEEAGDFLEVPAMDPTLTPEESSLIEGPGTKIGRYELLELIGEGGMGLVYLAKQTESVKRKVALKIVKLGMDTKQVVARFEAERQTLAVLEHPNIAHVFDAGTTETGRPYFVMEYVEGMSITKYCDDQKLSIEQRLELFRQVCEGVHYAHQKGIIHRDIKPSNILVSTNGDKAVPKIIDFGIAKAITQPLTEQTSFTKQGQLLGTPEYMSPEQAEMAYEDIDTRSDIYSLGVLLYELLAGATPFDTKRFREGGIDNIQQIICEEEPRTPSARLTSLGDKAKTIAESRRTQIITLTRRLHRELEWIPMKAMRKDRTRRYRSASELADDIQNYLTGTPLIAGPESTIYIARKFVRKHAGSVATAALVAVLIILGLIVSTALSFRAENARKEEAAARTKAERAEKIAEKQSKLAEKQRRLAEEQRRLAEEQRKLVEDQAENYRRALYFNRIALAEISYRDEDIRRLREQLDACPDDLRAWEWYHLNYISDQSLKTIHGHNGWKLGISPDGKHIASGGKDNTVKVWDTTTGVELMSLHSPNRQVTSVRFSPDGKRIVSGSYDGTLEVCHVENAKKLMTLKAHEAPSGALFSPDGTRIISGSNDGTIKVWNAETGTELRSWQAHTERGRCHTISPDGRCIASGGNDDVIRLWDIRTGAELMVLCGHRGEIVALQFSPDGKQIISGSWDNTVKVWDSATGEELMTFSGHKGWIHDVTFDPCGRRIASGSRDGTVKVWDIQTGEELVSLIGHRGSVTSVAFSPDGERIFSCSVDGTIKIWNSSENPEYMCIGEATVVGFSADWQRIVSGDEDGRIKVWDASTGTQLMTLHGPKGDMISDARFSPDGGRIYSGQIRKGTIWDAATGTELMSFRANAGYVYATFSPDGKYVASWVAEYWDEGREDNKIKLRDAKTGKEIMTFEDHEGELWGVAFSPDSKRLASCDIDETIKILDVKTGKTIIKLKHPGGIFSIAFSQDGRLIASGGSDADNAVRLWDAETGKEIMSLKGHFRGVGTLIFSPDGKRLITEGRDRSVKLWDISTGTEVMSFGAARLVSISPDGKTIAIAKAGGITLLESEVPPDGYENRRIGVAARKVVDELYEAHGSYSQVIDKLKADETCDESVRKVAIQIANARLWEDKEKKQ